MGRKTGGEKSMYITVRRCGGIPSAGKKVLVSLIHRTTVSGLELLQGITGVLGFWGSVLLP